MWRKQGPSDVLELLSGHNLDFLCGDGQGSEFTLQWLNSQGERPQNADSFVQENPIIP